MSLSCLQDQEVKSPYFLPEPTTPTHITQLPPDVLSCFFNLSLEDIRVTFNLALTCKKWHQVFTSNDFWAHFIYRAGISLPKDEGLNLRRAFLQGALYPLADQIKVCDKPICSSITSNKLPDNRNIIFVGESRFISYFNSDLCVHDLNGDIILSISSEDRIQSVTYFRDEVYYILKNGKTFLHPMSKEGHPRLLYQTASIEKLESVWGYRLLADDHWLVCYSQSGIEVRNRQTMQVEHQIPFVNQSLLDFNLIQIHYGNLYWVISDVDKKGSLYCLNLRSNKETKYELPWDNIACFLPTFAKCYFFVENRRSENAYVLAGDKTTIESPSGAPGLLVEMDWLTGEFKLFCKNKGFETPGLIAIGDLLLFARSAVQLYDDETEKPDFLELIDMKSGKILHSLEIGMGLYNPSNPDLWAMAAFNKKIMIANQGGCFYEIHFPRP